jgi:hypothetical protein
VGKARINGRMISAKAEHVVIGPDGRKHSEYRLYGAAEIMLRHLGAGYSIWCWDEEDQRWWPDYTGGDSIRPILDGP